MTDREKLLINALLPEVKERYLEYRKEVESHGIRECVTVTARSVLVQLQKEREGKSTNKVGWHQLRRALDRELWDPVAGRWDNEAKGSAAYFKANGIAEKYGFRQIGFHPDGTKRFIGKRSTWDPFHLEFRAPWDTLLAAVEAEAPELQHLLA